MEKAAEYLLQAKAIAEVDNLETEIIQICSILGIVYIELNRNDEVLSLFNRALEIAQNNADTLNTIQCLNQIGDFYNDLSRIDNSNDFHQTAKKYLDDALKLALKINAAVLINEVRTSLLRWYSEERKYKEALEYAQEILNNTDVDNPNNSPILILVYDYLVAIYAHLGNAQKAIDAHQQYDAHWQRHMNCNYFTWSIC